MSDTDPMAEAYHVLGALRYQTDQAKQALQEQISQLAQKGDDLAKQLEEAEQLDDGDAIERIRGEIEDLHRAYALAADELEQHDGQDQPQEEPDADEQRVDAGGDESQDQAADSEMVDGDTDRPAADTEGRGEVRGEDEAPPR